MPPRRPFFQIHLSTAIVLMFTAGGLIWANVTRRTEIIGTVAIFNYDSYGWPNTVIRYIKSINGTFDAKAMSLALSRPYLFYGMVILNVMIGVLIQAMVWLMCEWLIRRRASRNGA